MFNPSTISFISVRAYKKKEKSNSREHTSHFQMMRLQSLPTRATADAMSMDLLTTKLI